MFLGFQEEISGMKWVTALVEGGGGGGVGGGDALSLGLKGSEKTNIFSTQHQNLILIEK